MKKLVIYNGQNDIEKECDYAYSLNIGKILNTQLLNDTDKLNQLALDLRDEYCDFIYTLNDNFLKHDLVYEDRLSLYFISEVANKRTESFDTYVNICHLSILQSLIVKYEITSVECIGCDKKFLTSLNSVVKVSIIEQNIVKNSKSRFLLLKQIKFFTKAFFTILAFKFLCKNKVFKQIHNLFLTRYPLHFDENFKEDKYGTLINEDDTYLISILTDGMHQGLSLKKNIESLINLKKVKNHNEKLLLDRDISINDCIRSFIYSVQLLSKFKHISNEKYFFKNINIGPFIKEEIAKSFLRIPRLTMYKNAIIKIFNTNTITNFYYYLHEYSYGKFFSYILKEYTNETRRIGFQHGPSSKRKMLYFLSNNEVDYNSNNYKKYIPLPDIVLAEDEESKSVYVTSGYKDVKIMERIYRLEYLENIKRDNIKKGSILVACGLHDGLFIYETLKNEIAKNKTKKYYFKLHPRSANKKIINQIDKDKLTNIEIATDHVSEYLSFVEEVVFTYSSVGLEAHKLGIKVRTISLPNKINESPLYDLKRNC